MTANNGSEILHKIFRSICNQSYTNFDVVFIDDGSNDTTYQRAKELANIHHCNRHFTFIQNEKKKGSTECLLEQVQGLQDDDIVVFFEENSWFSDNMVLHRLNEVFKNQDVWLAYCQHANYKTKEKGKCIPVSSKNLFSNSMRRKPWFSPRLKCFYASLFKKVHVGDFFFRGKCVHEAFDSAYMFPMIEMAKDHVIFLPQIQCHFVNKDVKDRQRPSFLYPRKCQQKIMATSAYPPLKDLSSSPSLLSSSADLLIFSYDRPLQLFALLESVEQKFKGLDQIAVLYKTSSNSFDICYEKVKDRFKQVRFIKQTKTDGSDFKPLILTFVQEISQSDHIIFSVDDIIVKSEVDIPKSIHLLETSHAFFFSFRLGDHIKYCYMGGYAQNIPNFVEMPYHTMAWQLDSARGDWNYYYSLDMTLYRKKDVLDVFTDIFFDNPNTLEPAWEKAHKKKHKSKIKQFIGLCYRDAKAINIPLNIVSSANNKNMNLYSKEDLLSAFEKGLKMDIEPIASLQNESVHFEYEPTFIQR